MASQNKKISIIGGSGFVGTNLCRHLSVQQRDFEIIDLKTSKQFPEKCKIADVRDIESLRETVTGKIVIHLAAIHRDDVKDKAEYTRTNIQGSENVAIVCSEKNIEKLIFTSSVAVYGFAEPGTDENGRINPFNEYGQTKFLAEEKLRSLQSKQMSLIIVRPTVIFGEGNRGNVYNLFNQIACKRFLMIGNGENKKSMAYIHNVVAFLDACISTDRPYALFNYTDSPDLTMNQLVSQVREELLGRVGTGIRLPYWLGILLGYFSDWLSKSTGAKLPVSSLRVKKFASSSEFVSSKSDLDGFVTPFLLTDGISQTLKSEFISPDSSKEIFFTE